ncbi:dipeptidase [Prodigiosinella aquatilis]|uniref:dipeptidase n=1 Tax=Brenneria uluponensis TaxID=3057057 RepID=UPI0025B3FED6|nr:MULTISPECIES: dipeptidase [Pectobacteriaceae]WJV54134.1 dipeptidase [Prodigiosinella sp. LS101]WJV58497.1 dipeptidase [Pectobacteriaceae bacterium C111]
MTDKLICNTERIPVFDGHNDVLSQLWRQHREHPVEAFITGPAQGQIDLPRIRQGGLAGGLFATYIPSPQPKAITVPDGDPLFTPHATPSMQDARDIAFFMLSTLLRIEADSAGRAKICRSVADIRRCMAEGVLAMVMHIEGAEMLDADLNLLDILYAAGLRSLGPLWSRPNIFGSGVPFRFPSSPDTGDGLTKAGIRLVRACNAKRIMVDVSHMDEKGFWQTTDISDAPLVASHSNAHALCAQSRNLTDRQLAAIRDSQGFVGVNFGTAFLREDGRKDPNATVQEIVRHVEYLLEKVGENSVGFGSDFDGTTTPPDLKDIASLPILVQALAAQGYERSLLEKICYGNWLRVLDATWGE